MTNDPQPVDDGGWEQWRTLTAQAYGRYHDQLLALRGDYPGLTDYNASERVEATAGTMAWRWGADSELRETINSINGWGPACIHGMPGTRSWRLSRKKLIAGKCSTASSSRSHSFACCSQLASRIASR
ncbi:hypothetical protein [Luteimonas notoginsengisoli]|uniref:Uncharacterized protein n=1 Tax=Luteimonas notoginsengisoli TaxID=1578200 RepID=A0ABV7UWY0_9GAMM